MKKLIVLIVMIMSCICINAQDNINYNKKEKVYSKSAPTSYVGTITKYKYKDDDGIDYPIYISDSGECYILKDGYDKGKHFTIKKDLDSNICSVISDKYGIHYNREIIKEYDYKVFSTYDAIIKYFKANKKCNIISVIYKDYNYEVFYYYNK